MFSSTWGPSPFHSTLYSPGGNCLPCTSTLSYRCSVPLLAPAAKALAASSSDAPAKVTRFLDPFIFRSLSDCPRENSRDSRRSLGGTYSRMRRRCRCHTRSEEHTSELQSHSDLVCRLLLGIKNDLITR